MLLADTRPDLRAQESGFQVKLIKYLLGTARGQVFYSENYCLAHPNQGSRRNLPLLHRFQSN